MHFVEKALFASPAPWLVGRLNLYVVAVIILCLATTSLCEGDAVSLTVTEDRVVEWVTVNLTETKNFTVTVPDSVTKDSSAHIQFYSLMDIDDQRTFIKYGLPSILLYTWFGSPPPPPIQQRKVGDRNCSKFDPCFLKRNNSYVDREAVLNNFDYAYSRLDNLDAMKGDQIKISISNYDRLSRTTPEPVLKGVLHIRFVTNSSESCPMVISWDNEAEQVESENVCNGKGDCIDGVCQCVTEDEYYAGRACEQPVIKWLNDSSVEPAESNTKFGRFSLESVESENKLTRILVTAPYFSSLLFRVKYTEEDKKVPYVLLAAISKNLSVDANDGQLQSLTPYYPQLYVYSGKHEGQQGDEFGNFLRRKTDELSDWDQYNKSHSYSAITKKTEDFNPGYVSVFLNASFWDDSVPLNASFVIIRVSCPNESCGTSISLPFVLLPISLVAMSLAVIAIVTLLCLDRRIRGRHKVNKLTSDELQRMYPSSPFSQRSNSSVLNGTDSSNSDVTCSICLCLFSSEEPVREFRCKHLFHAECVDVS